MDILSSLQKLSITDPDLVEVTIDEHGEVEFEIEYDFFLAILKEHEHGFRDDTTPNGGSEE